MFVQIELTCRHGLNATVPVGHMIYDWRMDKAYEYNCKIKNLRIKLHNMLKFV